jgi:hypothetical protein
MTYYGPALPLRIFGSTKPQPPGLTPSELAARWPTQPPENLAIPLGQWLHRDHAAKLIAKANGADLAETGMCWLQAMIRAGLVDCQGFDVRLLPESERPGSPEYAARPGSPEAAADEARLSRLAADLKALGLRAVPEE